MRTAVIFFSINNNEKLRNIAQALAAGIEKQGCYVDLIDGDRDINSKLTIYNYIAVGTESTTPFGGKISNKVTEFLANNGIVTGKRSFAFILRSGLRTTKSLTMLMKAMEHEGMFLKYSDIIGSVDEAKEIGEQLHITT